MTPEPRIIADVTAESGVVTLAFNTGGDAPIRIAMSSDAASALADTIKSVVARTARIEIAEKVT
jgi:hypothetical protein